MNPIWTTPVYSNAWSGEAAQGLLDIDRARPWAGSPGLVLPQSSLAAEEVDLADWQHPEVGWGLR